MVSDLGQARGSDTPFNSRVTFIEGLAAVCGFCPEEVSRKVAGLNKEVYSSAREVGVAVQQPQNPA